MAWITSRKEGDISGMEGGRMKSAGRFRNGEHTFCRGTCLAVWVCVRLMKENRLGFFKGQHERCAWITIWQSVYEQRRTKSTARQHDFPASSSQLPASQWKLRVSTPNCRAPAFYHKAGVESTRSYRCIALASSRTVSQSLAWTWGRPSLPAPGEGIRFSGARPACGGASGDRAQ